MENIVFKKRYAPITGDENNIYKTLSELPLVQDLDSDKYSVSVFEEVALWVLLGISIGVVTIAAYVLWEIVQ